MMPTSLPDTDALFHVTARVFQRSAGRSAVAAAAYRSASCLTDERIGETFDYTRKHCVEAFILAPPGAPEWAYDRGELWNRVEAAEKRKDAQVAREVEVGIPRDIPESEWQAFAEEVCRHYVEAGAIVDVAIHCPRAADGEPQPHFHAMITQRGLDASTGSGFAKARNAAVNAIFASGGRHGGGERGEALKAERERIAALMNGFLARAGSARRADHRSNAARGLHDREPEPRIGEGRRRAVLRRRRHDRRTAAVSAMRQARIVANALTATEEKIMQTNPTRQAKGGIRPRTKIDFKARLLRKRFPDFLSVEGWAGSLHFVDTSDPSFTRIATKDGGHIEVRNRIARVYGQRGQADALAAAIEAAGDVDAVERLEQLRTLQRRGSGIRQRQKPDGVSALPAAEVESLADRWRSRGYHRITEAPDGVWIEIGRCRLQDLGDELRVHGPVASDAAVRAMVEKAAAEWAGEVEVWGDQAFKDQIWLEAQRQGITVYDQATGELYHPSEEVRARYDRDRSRLKAEGEEIEEIKRRKAIASLLLEAASGNAEALSRLRTNDRDLADFVTLHLDDEQRGRLVGKPEADVVAALADFRSYGRAARAAEDERRKAERRVVGYVVSNEHGTVELETEDLSEAYEYKDALDTEGRSAAIGTAYSDGSISFDTVHRRLVSHLDAETHERRPT